MRQFEIQSLVDHVATLDTICVLVGTKPEQNIESEELNSIRENFENVHRYCHSVGFDRARRKVSQSIEQIEDHWKVTPPWILAEARNIKESLLMEVEERKFLVIDSADAGFVNNPFVLGEVVATIFPEASEDIKEAGNCLAVGCDTAAVFHLMRIAEHGLRRLAKRLRVRLTHVNRFLPIELAGWDKAINGIHGRITAIRTTRKSIKRIAQLERYSDAADHCLFMKDIWRNAVSHTRKPYSHPEALAAFGRVRDFMTFLASSLLRTAS